MASGFGLARDQFLGKVSTQGVNVDAISHQDCNLLDGQAVAGQCLYLLALRLCGFKGWSTSTFTSTTLGAALF